MTLAVDNPIVNSPFEEPTRYWWDYQEGQPTEASFGRIELKHSRVGWVSCKSLKRRRAE